ncbi:class I SAM-dependent methyltransferase [Clostridium beijerinckii]|uniref:Class I SAM-dependent methyltransferase n=1 Tax=Clostridium beijerinckii TaxID=1520 RepID=A0A7X9XNU1_CLOBE|nr:class I SAM-dependent methyltransferase [Clostridium beijerinckii]NMF04276.1 class I SAM-dependent methyltransferase [Clostridium beijerinckii]
MINIPFDQYQRYKTTADVVDSYRRENQTFRILEVGANAHRNLEKFLVKDDITYIDIDFPDDLQDEHMIKGDATDMIFEDKSFDIVVGLDVYEHIPKDRRMLFIKEISRVAKEGFIIGAPFDYDKTTEAEYRVNSLYKSLYGVDFIWLEEHIQNLLPSMKQTREYLEDDNIPYIIGYHGNIDIWEKLMSMYFLSTKNQMSQIYKEQLDSFYNKYIYSLDFEEEGENVYRSFVIGGKWAKLEKIREVVKPSDHSERDKEYRRLLSFSENFFLILHNEINTSKLDEYIEVFADNYNYKIEITEEEIIGNRYVEKFIPLNNKAINQGIRIDPCNKKSVIYIENIFLKCGENIEVGKYTSTASTSIDNIYYFEKDDPQIQLVNVIGKKLTGIIIRFKYLQYDSLNVGPISYVAKMLNENALINDKLFKGVDEISKTVESIYENAKLEIANKENIINNLQSIINGKEKIIDEKEKNINELNNSVIEKENCIKSMSQELSQIKSMRIWKLIEWIQNRRK